MIALYDRLLEGGARLPGVKSAALASVVPMGGDSDTSFDIEGRPAPAAGERPPVAWYRLVSAGYFELMGLRLRAGQLFTAGEPRPVIVINETMGRRYWPGENAVGKRIRPSPDAPWFTIVGIVNDVKSRGAAGGTQVEMFVPYWQMPELGMYVLLKPTGDPAPLAEPLRDMVASIDRELPVAGVRTLDAVVAGSIQQPRFFAAIAGVFGLIALALAGIGIYGVMAYTVAQRRAEIGVRLALGAAERQIFGLVVGDGLRLAGIGLAVGFVAALGVGRALQSLLYGVRRADPLTFGTTAAVLLAVAFAATYLPARRAMRTDPIEALRVE
jgi:putative ABC transport system permease protein